MRREQTLPAASSASPVPLQRTAPGHASRPQVIIAGAGPGGLAAAMLLAHAGAEVVVLERKDRVGGRSATLRADGFNCWQPFVTRFGYAPPALERRVA